MAEEIFRCLAVELANIVMMMGERRETHCSWHTVVSLTAMTLHPLLHHLTIEMFDY